jgi:epoxyqueuosine reductase
VASLGLTLEQLSELVTKHGFSGFSVARSGPRPQASKYLKLWRESGFAAEMNYLSNPPNRDQPDLIMEGTKSILSVAMNYFPGASIDPKPEADAAFIARYARGNDYHRVLKARLATLAEELQTLTRESIEWRACVDTAPLLERDYAAAGGLGFIAKSSMLITPGIGSYTLLGELLIDGDLPVTESTRERCGSCTQCIVDCPTDAFVGPRILDSRKCISYWTIETRASIPVEIREVMENMVFGCDRCQEVCPFNASPKAKEVDEELAPIEKLQRLTLEALLNLTTSDHKRLVRGTALERAARDQLMRNAAVAMGNSGSQRFVKPLAEALFNNRYPVVREHCAWALGKLGGAEARKALAYAGRPDGESDPAVNQAIAEATKRCGGG